MTSTATPLGPDGMSQLRARLTYATREAPEPSRASRPNLFGLSMTLGGLATAAVLFVALAMPRGAPEPRLATAPVLPVAVAPPAPAWVDVVHPFTAYDLAGGPFAKLPLTYAARRDAGGTARQDTLTYGVPTPGEPFLRLTFLRHGAEPATETTVFVDAARLAASGGLAVTRSGLSSKLTTRFGDVEVVGVAVARRDRSATCLAFRSADPGSAAVVSIVGLACGTDEKPVDLAGVACTIEKVDLVSAGDDEDLRAVFVAAERRRGSGCQDERRASLRPGLTDDGGSREPLKGSL